MLNNKKSNSIIISQKSNLFNNKILIPFILANIKHPLYPNVYPHKLRLQLTQNLHDRLSGRRSIRLHLVKLLQGPQRAIP